MKIVFPGSFDPITFGHVDVIARGSRLFDTLIVAVAQNTSKNSLLTLDERVELASAICNEFDNVEVTHFSGLLIDFARQKNVDFILRSLRSSADVSWELQQAMMNRAMAQEIETIFLPPSVEYQAISATLVREIAMNRGDLTSFVDQRVARKLQEVVSRSR